MTDVKTTTDLIVSQVFEGKEIRAIERDGQVWIPLIDLAGAWGTHRNTLGNLLIRNPEVFEGYYALVTCAVKKRPDSQMVNDTLSCVNEQGLYLLMGRVSAGRIKTPGAKETIIRFQRWIPELIKAIRKGELVPAVQAPPVSTQPQLLGDVLTDYLKIADARAKYAGVDRGIAVLQAYALVEYHYNVDLTAYKEGVRRERQLATISHLTPTQIGNELGGLTPISINKILHKLGYQVYIIDRWHPTKIGEGYCEAYPVYGMTESGKSYSRYQLKWSPKIVEILREHLFGIEEKFKQGAITGYI